MNWCRNNSERPEKYPNQGYPYEDRKPILMNGLNQVNVAEALSASGMSCSGDEGMSVPLAFS